RSTCTSFRAVSQMGKDGGSRWTSLTQPACRHSIARRQISPSQFVATLPPEPFFGGPGLDRAAALRPHPAASAKLPTDSGPLQRKWLDGLPELTAVGKLSWSPVSNPELFRGLDGDSPRFSAIEPVTADARSAFPLLAVLDAADAPLFAAALSLARWH